MVIYPLQNMFVWYGNLEILRLKTCSHIDILLWLMFNKYASHLQGLISPCNIDPVDNCYSRLWIVISRVSRVKWSLSLCPQCGGLRTTLTLVPEPTLWGPHISTLKTPSERHQDAERRSGPKRPLIHICRERWGGCSIKPPSLAGIKPQLATQKCKSSAWPHMNDWN